MEFERRQAQALAPVLFLLAVTGLSLLAFNLRNLDRGAEELPPPIVTETPPACAVGAPNCEIPEGVGSPLRSLFLIVFLTIAAAAIGGAVYLRARGVKLTALLSPWELLAYAFALAFIVTIFLYYDQVHAGLSGFFRWVTGERPVAEGATGSGSSPPVGSSPATILLILGAAIVILYVVVFSSAVFPRLYSIASYQAPDVSKSKRELARAVRTAIRDLESGGDFRATVLRCYKSMIVLLEARGVRADPSQTAREFEAEALRGLGVSRGGIDDLTSLFEEARYSRHVIGEGHREAALASLRAVRGQLEGAA